MRENTIRINALEIKNIDITNIEAPKEMLNKMIKTIKISLE